ncbi:MAG: Rossmann-like domain-containing protein [Candidatus Bathyarchaeia archaeon]|jgi:uncharacterized protein (DUF4213/DUF364 family)
MNEKNLSSDAWQLYDALIEGIPEDWVVDDVVCGVYHAFVRSGNGAGFCMVAEDDTRPVMLHNKLPGMKLKELAAAVKSWNFIEASIGQAAINAYYNTLPVAQKNGVAVSDSRFVEDRSNDPFISYQNAIRNKKVAVIEHFPFLEQLFEPVCDLSIFARLPQDCEYPYSAAEYLLPSCDYVFITCGAFVDKSLPRFLKLASKAHVVVVGPSTPLASVLFQFGVHDLSGFVIKDVEKARRICLGQENYLIYSTGQKVSFKSEQQLP